MVSEDNEVSRRARRTPRRGVAFKRERRYLRKTLTRRARVHVVMGGLPTRYPRRFMRRLHNVFLRRHIHFAFPPCARRRVNPLVVVVRRFRGDVRVVLRVDISECDHVVVTNHRGVRSHPRDLLVPSVVHRFRTYRAPVEFERLLCRFPNDVLTSIIRVRGLSFNRLPFLLRSNGRVE